VPTQFHLLLIQALKINHRVHSDLQGSRRRFCCNGFHWILRKTHPHPHVRLIRCPSHFPYSYRSSRNNILVYVSLFEALLYAYVWTVEGHNIYLVNVSHSVVYLGLSRGCCVPYLFCSVYAFHSVPLYNKLPSDCISLWIMSTEYCEADPNSYTRRRRATFMLK
jgi:hypothetical protein